MADESDTLLPGLLNETLCKKPITIKTELISDTYDVDPRPFARGKFATVRRCLHRASGVYYAAKYIRKRRRSAIYRQEILHEAYVLQLSRDNPHIVQLHEVYETASEVILVLEMVEGGELQRVLDDEEVVPEREAAHLMRQILAGLLFLHDHNIAHLDLKPQNLLLTKPFPHCEVKLCDFGISRFITKGIEIREIVGTPDYVAPEILHYEPISLPTDMWSIGILTYVLLSGHSPFGGDTKQETFCNITRGSLEFPSDLFGTISNDAKDFIRRLLVRDPRYRMSVKDCLTHSWLSTEKVPFVQGIEITLSPSESFSLGRESQSEGEDSEGVEPFSPSPRKKRHPQVSPSDVNVVNHYADERSENGFHKMAPQSEPIANGCPKTTPQRDQTTANGNKYNNCNSDQSQNGVRSVEHMVANFEGLTMTKRIIFSEEIIVEERVGMVY